MMGSNGSNVLLMIQEWMNMIKFLTTRLNVGSGGGARRSRALLLSWLLSYEADVSER
jgi:hypothetical protein